MVGITSSTAAYKESAKLITLKVGGICCHQFQISKMFSSVQVKGIIEENAQLRRELADLVRNRSTQVSLLLLSFASHFNTLLDNLH